MSLYKANPDVRDVHVDTVLTNISVGYVRTQNYIASRVFPVVPVRKQSDRYFVYNKADWLRARATKLAPSSETAGSGYTVSTDTYFADVWGFHKDVDDFTRANADSPIDLDADATELVTNTILLTREKEWINSFFVPGVWANQYVGVAASPGPGQFLRWDNANSDPVADVRRARLAIHATTGLRANVGVFDRRVYEVLTEHPIVVERVKYTQRALGEDLDSTAILAALFKLRNIYVVDAIEDVNGTTGFISGKHAWVGYVTDRPGLLKPTAGYIFSWRFSARAGDAEVVINRYRLENIRSDRIEGLASWDMKVVAADLGAFFQDAIS